MIKIKNSKRLITVLLVLFFLGSIVYRLNIKQTDLLLDLSGSIILITLYLIFFKKLKQDSLSYSVLAIAIAIHNMYLYGTTIFGIRFDHYMHFLGGIAIALVIDRVLRDKLTKKERCFLAIISALGVGAIGEIIEWLGYSYLRGGDGFFLYGKGDGGEWQNASMDMIFNFIGGVFSGIMFILFSKRINKRKQSKTVKY